MDDTPQISPEHKLVTREVVASLPKAIVSDRIGTATSTKDIEARVRTHAEELAHDGVVYAEFRFAPADSGLAVGDAIDAAMRGLDEASGIDGRLIISAAGNTPETRELAEVSVDKRQTTDRIVGFDLGRAREEQRDAAAYLRRNFVPVVAQADTFEEVSLAVDLGVQRIAHALNVVDDFEVSVDGIATGPVSTWIRDRGLALEFSPTLEHSRGLLDDYEDHPITLLQQMGFSCVVGPGLSDATSTTDELYRLVTAFDYGLDELFDLTRLAVEKSLAPVERRRDILAAVLAGYEQLADEADLDAAEES